MDKRIIYLDHAAATPVDPVAIEAMMPYFSEYFYNPSSIHACGVLVRQKYQAAKQRIARQLGVRADELVMTTGATESNNMALNLTGEQLAVAEIEHSSVLGLAVQLGGALIKVDSRGKITPEAVKKVITPKLTLISIGLVNNELGTIQPIEEIGRVIEGERQRRVAAGDETPLYFHSDASQALALIDIKPNRLGVDMLTLSAAKIYGPKQVGLLWVRPGVNARPTLIGGGQEQGLRSGTENPAGVEGFAVALELASKRRNSEVRRLRQLRDRMQTALTERFPEMMVLSSGKKGLASFLNISFPGIDAERLVFLLEQRGVMVATGSACAANRGKRSHVLQAIGLSDSEIDGSLRISLGRLSTEDNCQAAVEAIVEAVQIEQGRAGR